MNTKENELHKIADEKTKKIEENLDNIGTKITGIKHDHQIISEEIGQQNKTMTNIEITMNEATTRVNWLDRKTNKLLRGKSKNMCIINTICTLIFIGLVCYTAYLVYNDVVPLVSKIRRKNNGHINANTLTETTTITPTISQTYTETSVHTEIYTQTQKQMHTTTVPNTYTKS